jgi:hypothetical protein
MSWQELQELTNKLYTTPEPVVKRMQEILAATQVR